MFVASAWPANNPKPCQVTGNVSPCILDSGFLYTAVRVQLSDADFNELVRLDTLATSTSDTYLSLSTDVITDVQGNNAVAISPSNAVAGGYVKDNSKPTLVAFSINLNAETLTLTLSETIRAGTLSVVGITLQNGVSASGTNAVTLTGARSTSAVNGLTVTVQFAVVDLNLIKKYQIVTSQSYIVLAAASINDMAGNGVEGVPNGQALRTTAIVGDTTRPSLLSFKLDMTAETITLTFDETVLASSLDVTQLIVQNAMVASDSCMLTAASTHSAIDSTVLEDLDAHTLTRCTF